MNYWICIKNVLKEDEGICVWVKWQSCTRFTDNVVVILEYKAQNIQQATKKLVDLLIECSMKIKNKKTNVSIEEIKAISKEDNK